MIDDVDEIAALLRGTVLQAYPVEEADGNALVIGIGHEDVETAWRAARRIVPETGRWPVALSGTDLGDIPEAELARLDELARRIDPWPHFAGWERDFGEAVSRDEAVANLQAWLHVDLSAHLAAQLPAATTWSQVDRVVYDLMVEQPRLAQPVQGHLDYLREAKSWYVPHEGVDLVLLPAASQWQATAWLNYYGAPAVAGIETLSAVLWQWHRDHGAELVASWGTMLQFVVDRPPAPGDQAWTLARQMNAVGGSLQDPDWLLAFALPDCRHWFLHDRP